MKRFFTLLLLVSACAFQAAAQAGARFGTLHYDSLLTAMPEYAAMQREMSDLRAKYEAEADYNDASFKRQFAEFLQGQKDFPQNIMLKRQRDLQNAMERGIAFRQEADSLLSRAEADMLSPIRQRLDKAVADVALECGYELVINLDERTFPFVHPQVCEDITALVCEKLGL